MVNLKTSWWRRLRAPKISSLLCLIWASAQGRSKKKPIDLQFNWQHTLFWPWHTVVLQWAPIPFHGSSWFCPRIDGHLIAEISHFPTRPNHICCRLNPNFLLINMINVCWFILGSSPLVPFISIQSHKSHKPLVPPFILKTPYIHHRFS